jgi:tetratricopeptide (TPR) repeat protein
MLKWFSAREATEVGTALADGFVLQTASDSAAVRRAGGKPAAARQELQRLLQKFLQSVDREARPLKLNLFRRAKLANSFKWRLLEKGVEKEVVEELTQALLIRLTAAQKNKSQDGSRPASAGRRSAASLQALLARGDQLMAQRAWEQAAGCYQELLDADPRHAVARNNLGAALSQLGRYQQAEQQFRRAVGIRASDPDAQGNLGVLLQLTGRIAESEMPLRRALKLKPSHLDARASLGVTYSLLGRTREARDCFQKTLTAAPRHLIALIGTGQLAAYEGRSAEAEDFYRRALEVDPKAATAWAGLVALRRMTPADEAWLKGAETAAAGGLTPADEASLRFAMGKYYDDIGDFARAFRSYQRGNELHKLRAAPYDRSAHRAFVDDLVRVYSREALHASSRASGSDSSRPVLVTGMMRSGTSLVEQIIASHPAARGAGELGYWAAAVSKHESALRHEPPREALKRQLADGYLRMLAGRFPDAQRVVDKNTVNSDYLGIIHDALPHARLIYLRRDPIDTCLSCYFQQFSSAVNFTMDLSDLAHYYREHRRLVAHWRGVLPADALLEVPYEQLVADPETWTRRIVEFIGLPWDERCLDFHKTQRTVTTASTWQVRQKVYKSSVGRSRNYQKFIGPLLELEDLG